MENSPLRLSIEELALLLDMLMIQQLPGQAALSLPAPVTDHAGLLRASVTRSV